MNQYKIQKINLSEIGKALLLLLLITIISHLFKGSLDIINIALIHIIPVVVIAMHGDQKATFFITLLSVICFNFLYVPPIYSFSVSNDLYLWSFIIFGIVGWIITLQAQNLNTQRKQNAFRESLLHIISHDLRTPLSTIHGTINFILSNNNLDTEKTKSLLEDINFASYRMKRLITNILDSTRFSSGDVELKYEWCDFEDIIGVALEEFSQYQNEELLQIKIDRLELFWGDNTLLIQLIVNLLDNAFKYSKEKSIIKLDISHSPDFVKISIFNESDTIEKKKLKNIFDKFYRLEDTNDISGSGIGLAICKSIVQLHTGAIIASSLDNGILIEIKLPILKKASLL
jgi:two-component system sensor histidine kinase KdpD